LPFPGDRALPLLHEPDSVQAFGDAAGNLFVVHARVFPGVDVVRQIELIGQPLVLFGVLLMDISADGPARAAAENAADDSRFQRPADRLFHRDVRLMPQLFGQDIHRLLGRFRAAFQHGLPDDALENAICAYLCQ